MTSQRTSFLPIANADALRAVLAAPHLAVVFLHDPTCQISADAFEEMEGLGGNVHLIDVTHQHDLKREVERSTRVKHESPQVIVMREGVAVWNASHGRIRAAKVREALG